MIRRFRIWLAHCVLPKNAFTGKGDKPKELLHSPLFVGEYDAGGFLRPGWNLAYNGLGRPEPVGDEKREAEE